MTNVPGFGEPTLQPTPAPSTPRKRSAKANGKKKPSSKRGRPARKPGDQKRTRSGPAALTMNVDSAFKVLQGCKRKDVAAIQAITAQLNPLNRPGRERVMEAVKAIIGG